MTMKRLLLLSNSRNLPDEQPFEWAVDEIQSFFGPDVRELIFIPYAGVTLKWDDYAQWVQGGLLRLGYKLISIHTLPDPVAAIQNAQGLLVGGGNTFHLMYHLFKKNLVEAIRSSVLAGVPYMGWSAGGNITCPTLQTTNDMPIIQPPSFDALDLIPFQINPHYTSSHPPGHMGETRDDRLKEYIEVNRHRFVAGLPEGCLFRVEGERLRMVGSKKVRIFHYGTAPLDLGEEDDFLLLMQRP